MEWPCSSLQVPQRTAPVRSSIVSRLLLTLPRKEKLSMLMLLSPGVCSVYVCFLKVLYKVNVQVATATQSCEPSTFEVI